MLLTRTDSDLHQYNGINKVIIMHHYCVSLLQFTNKMLNKMVMITIYLGSEKRAIVTISVFNLHWWSRKMVKLTTQIGDLHGCFYCVHGENIYKHAGNSIIMYYTDNFETLRKVDVYCLLLVQIIVLNRLSWGLFYPIVMQRSSVFILRVQCSHTPHS